MDDYRGHVSGPRQVVRGYDRRATSIKDAYGASALGEGRHDGAPYQGFRPGRTAGTDRKQMARTACAARGCILPEGVHDGEHRRRAECAGRSTGRRASRGCVGDGLPAGHGQRSGRTSLLPLGPELVVEFRAGDRRIAAQYQGTAKHLGLAGEGDTERRFRGHGHWTRAFRYVLCAFAAMEDRKRAGEYAGIRF